MRGGRWHTHTHTHTHTPRARGRLSGISGTSRRMGWGCAGTDGETRAPVSPASRLTKHLVSIGGGGGVACCPWWNAAAPIHYETPPRLREKTVILDGVPQTKCLRINYQRKVDQAALPCCALLRTFFTSGHGRYNSILCGKHVQNPKSSRGQLDLHVPSALSPRGRRALYHVICTVCVPRPQCCCCC